MSRIRTWLSSEPRLRACPNREVSTIIRASRVVCSASTRSCVVSWHGNDRTFGQAHYALGDAAQDQSRQTAAPVRAHHDHFGVRRELDDLAVRRSVELVDTHAHARAAADFRLRFQILFGAPAQLLEQL